MAIWALADPHLSFGVPDKSMGIFGEIWVNWTDKIRNQWETRVASDDLVLVAGDISWALHPEEAVPDLEWIDRLPGIKVIVRGNHDYWWTSLSKAQKILPPSIHLIQNNTFTWNDVCIGGARLWDNPEFNFNQYINVVRNPKTKETSLYQRDDEMAQKVLDRELSRLELSLKELDQNARKRIVMTHYPPVSADLQDSRASALLEQYNVDTCVFGHLHNVKQEAPMFGTKNGIRYLLTSCDYLNFAPLRVE